MIFNDSRYAGAGTRTARRGDGRQVACLRMPPPVRARPRLLGFHRRDEGQRLDQLAAAYLKDATAFWRLCDANDAMAPDALAARDEIAIPTPDGG